MREHNGNNFDITGTPAPMSITNSAVATREDSTIERAIALLGSGLSPEIVASTLGVTPSYISQIMSKDEIATRVTQLRYDALQKHNIRDTTYDTIEDALLVKMDELLPLMMRPMEVLKAISVINAAKRRGQSAPEAIHQQQNIVQLIMPVQVIQYYQVDIKNTVIKTGEQDLLTMNPKHLLAKVKERQDEHLYEQLPNQGRERLPEGVTIEAARS